MKRACILLAFPLFLFCVSLPAQKKSPFDLQQITDDAYSYYLNNPDTAILLTAKALDLALHSRDTYYEGYCYFLFSKTYWVKANYKLSTEYGFKALKIFQNSSHHKALGASLLSVGRTLVELGNLDKAREFIGEALALGIEHDDDFIQAGAFREKSYLLTEMNQLDSALYYSDNGIALFQKLGDSLDMSVLYGRKSRIYFQQKKFEKSRRFAYQALLIDSLVGNLRGLGISYFQVAQNEYVMGNSQKAINQLK